MNILSQNAFATKFAFNYCGGWFPEKAVCKSVTNLNISVALETTQFDVKIQTDLMKEWVGTHRLDFWPWFYCQLATKPQAPRHLSSLFTALDLLCPFHKMKSCTCVPQILCRKESILKTSPSVADRCVHETQ